MWRKDGNELYFMTEDHTVMAVNVKASQASIELSAPTRLFAVKDMVAAGYRPPYAPAPDGQRFLFLVPIENERPEGLHLIHNWKP